MDIYLTEPIGPFHSGVRSTATFTTKQDVTPSPVPVILGGKLRAGSKLYLHADGDFSTTGTPNLTMGFWFGTRALAITGDIALSSVIATPSGAALFQWRMEWNGLCLAPGVAGTLIGSGKLQLGATISTFGNEVPIPITAALRTVTMDTTIERAMGVSATWGTSSASNIITVNDFRLQILN